MSPRSPARPRSSVRDYREAPRPATGTPGPFSFVLEGPPIPKARPRVTKAGHTYTPKGTKDAEAAVELLARLSGAQVHHGPVAVRLTFWHDGARARDWDNLAKTVCDALNGVCWLDDSQIRHAEVAVHVDPDHPRTEVEVRAWPPIVAPVETSLGIGRRIRVNELEDHQDETP